MGRSLLARLFGWEESKKSEQEIEERTQLPPEDSEFILPYEQRYSAGEYLVPSPLKEDGLYALQIAQSEMYDLGNCDFINHFIIYDRKNRIAVDVTSDIKPAPLLSATMPVEVCPNEEQIEILEEYLTGKSKPQFSEEYQMGIKLFKATEISEPSCECIRKKLLALRDARKTLDSLTDDFRTEIPNLKTKYFLYH